MNFNPSKQADRSQPSRNADHATGLSPAQQPGQSLFVIEEECHSFSGDNPTGNLEQVPVEEVSRRAQMSDVPDNATEDSP